MIKTVMGYIKVNTKKRSICYKLFASCTIILSVGYYFSQLPKDPNSFESFHSDSTLIIIISYVFIERLEI